MSDKDIRKKLNELTLEEKARLLTGGSFLTIGELPKKGYGEFLMMDGGTGINFEQLFAQLCMTERSDISDGTLLTNVRKKFFDIYLDEIKDEDSSEDNDNESELEVSDEEKDLYDWLMDRLDDRCTLGEMVPPTCFPGDLLMGSTWNDEVVEEVGKALADEAAIYKINMLFGTPFVNLMRDPRAGRSFEAYSEDPYLTAKLAAKMVTGVQSKGVAANVKHFFANNQEDNRRNVNECISKRAIQELYLPAFASCVEAGVATVMSAYNSVNGQRCTENKEMLTDWLRGEKGFKGAVVSDYGAVRDKIKALNAGNDIIMPGPVDFKDIAEAVEDGELDEKCIDESAARVIELREKYGSPKTEITSQYVLKKNSTKAALDAALEGIVMLKNEDIFPLEGNVCLVAEDDGYLYDSGTGSAGIDTSCRYSLYDELKKRQQKFKVTLNDINEKTDVVLVVVKTMGREGNDLESMVLDEKETIRVGEAFGKVSEYRRYGKKIKFGVILNIAAPIIVEEIKSDADGIICTFYPGSYGSRALAKILAGEAGPSGRLPVSFPKREQDLPTYINFKVDGNNLMYGEDIFVGYRYYNTKNIEVSYPFGYGLSYTDFSYGEMELSSKSFSEKLDVSVKVTNTGKVKGSEVVQLYIHDVKSTIRKPERELKAFRKIKLAPGESETVTFHLTKKDFASFDMDLDRWEAEEGEYDIILGKNAAETIKKCRITGTWKSAYTLGIKSAVKVLFENELSKKMLEQLAKDLDIDFGFLETVYEYNSYGRLKDVLAEVVDMKSPEVVAMLRVFDEELSSVSLI